MSITYSYNHEGNWTAAILQVMQTGGTSVITANIQASQSVTISRSPRIEIEVESDERASEQMAKIDGGEWYYSHRACVVVARIVTNRTAAIPQNHDSIRARVRYLFTREAQKLVPPTMTLYQTLDVQEQASNVLVRDPEGDREDMTELRHRIEYGILPNTVPTI
jgi:hypothetical protein